MDDQLIPRAPKRKKQPTAETMREQLRLAADEIIRLRSTPIIVRYDYDTRPWWRRLFGKPASPPKVEIVHGSGYQPLPTGTAPKAPPRNP